MAKFLCTWNRVLFFAARTSYGFLNLPWKGMLVIKGRMRSWRCGIVMDQEVKELLLCVSTEIYYPFISISTMIYFLRVLLKEFQTSDLGRDKKTDSLVMCSWWNPFSILSARFVPVIGSYWWSVTMTIDIVAHFLLTSWTSSLLILFFLKPKVVIIIPIVKIESSYDCTDKKFTVLKKLSHNFRIVKYWCQDLNLWWWNHV